jgi:hypothetical protein
MPACVQPGHCHPHSVPATPCRASQPRCSTPLGHLVTPPVDTAVAAQPAPRSGCRRETETRSRTAVPPPVEATPQCRLAAAVALAQRVAQRREPLAATVKATVGLILPTTRPQAVPVTQAVIVRVWRLAPGQLSPRAPPVYAATDFNSPWKAATDSWTVTTMAVAATTTGQLPAHCSS